MTTKKKATPKAGSKAELLSIPDAALQAVNKRSMDGVRIRAKGGNAGGLARTKRSREYLPKLREILFDPDLLAVWRDTMLTALEDPRHAMGYTRTLIRSMPPGALVGIEPDPGSVSIGKMIVLLPGALERMHGHEGEMIAEGEVYDTEQIEGEEGEDE